jgi:1-deoxy-D-xylulose-5-phosphate reductoisomerase
MRRQFVTVLGSTGSIGRQALDVIRARSDRFTLFGISANENVDLLIEQARRWKPQYVACRHPLRAEDFPEGTTVLSGPSALAELSSLDEPSIVVNGISGLAALEPLLCALKAGKRVAQANKESIVCGHRLVEEALRDFGGELIPVDSEQSAIFQCLSCGRNDEISRLWLTASGGPFWRLSDEELAHVTVRDALQHPTWHMGSKITIDSATLFNKGLEVIEASYLFHVPAECIDVLIHPQSIVHSMVEFSDRTLMANLSCPDMRLPIQYALTYPERAPTPCDRLSLAEIGQLTFHAADRTRFAGLRLAYEALFAGGTMPTVYNAANEAAVELFMEERIGFTDIAAFVEDAMLRHAVRPAVLMQDILDADEQARHSVDRFLHTHF